VWETTCSDAWVATVNPDEAQSITVLTLAEEIIKTNPASANMGVNAAGARRPRDGDHAPRWQLRRTASSAGHKAQG